MTSALVLLAALAAAEEPTFKVSLPTAEDEELWRTPGFRLHLGGGWGLLAGQRGAPSGSAIGVSARAGARLDERWSLLGSFHYAVVSSDGGLSGLRYAITLDPTIHPWRGLELALGVGAGGFVEGFTGRPDPDPTQASALNGSLTLVEPDPPLAYCSGTGVAALARATYLFVLGPASSTGLTLQLDGQWTGCVEDLGRVEPDTARPIERRQWWPHLGGSLSWTVAWR